METVVLKDRAVVSYTISDEDQAILIQIRDNLRRNYFLIGDIANKYVYESVKHDYAMNVLDIYEEIGRIVGKAGRTVRYYAEEAAFYTPSMREAYDILPFSFFVFARTLGDDWVHILEYAMEHPHYSLAAIKRHFLPTPDNTLDNSDQDGIMDYGKIDKPAVIVDQGEVQVGPIVNIMIDLSSRAISLIDSIPLPDDKKQRLVEAIMTIREIVASMV